MPDVVVDGYRSMDERTQDGIPSPVYHLVGGSSSIQIANGRVTIAYQDSTVLQLRVAQKQTNGKWLAETIAGHQMPFKGAYGFYASMRISGNNGIISSYAVNQTADSMNFYVEAFALDLGLIM